MLDVVKSILDILGKGIYNPDMEKIKKEKKLAGVGIKLFKFYIELHNIYHRGQNIVDLMRKYNDIYHNSNDSDSLRYIIDKYKSNVESQLFYLNRASYSLEKLKIYLDILDADGTIRIIDLMFSKGHPLGYITQLLEDPKVFIAPMMNTPSSNMTKDLSNVTETKLLQDKFLVTLIMEDGSIYYDTVYKIFSAYINQGKADLVLAELKLMADKIKQTIEKNFSMQDILLGAEKEPFEDIPSYERFEWKLCINSRFYI